MAHFFISEEIFDKMWGKSEKMQSGHKIRRIIYAHFKLSYRGSALILLRRNSETAF
jgi:hypothetical protein